MKRALDKLFFELKCYFFQLYRIRDYFEDDCKADIDDIRDDLAHFAQHKSTCRNLDRVLEYTAHSLSNASEDFERAIEIIQRRERTIKELAATVQSLLDEDTAV